MERFLQAGMLATAGSNDTPSAPACLVIDLLLFLAVYPTSYLLLYHVAAKSLAPYKLNPDRPPPSLLVSENPACAPEINN